MLHKASGQLSVTGSSYAARRDFNAAASLNYRWTHRTDYSLRVFVPSVIQGGLIPNRLSFSSNSSRSRFFFWAWPP